LENFGVDKLDGADCFALGQFTVAGIAVVARQRGTKAKRFPQFEKITRLHLRRAERSEQFGGIHGTNKSKFERPS